MKALATQKYGSIHDLQVVDLPAPECGRGQVRVRVSASAANPADYKVVTGAAKILHARQFPLVPGYDFAGAVDAVGEGADLAVGDRVFGHLDYSSKTKVGAFAEFVVVDAMAVGRIPAGVGEAEAAGLATPGLTALQAIRDKGGLPATGGRVLIVGASGGVGAAAVQVAKRLGATVTGVCRGHAVDFVRGLGADVVIDREQADPLTTAGEQDVIFDAAAAWKFGAARKQLAPRGAFVTTLPSVDLIVGTLATLFSKQRCKFIIVRSRRADLELLGGWLADGLKVPFDARFPVREVPAALERLMEGRMSGRVGIDVAGGF